MGDNKINRWTVIGGALIIQVILGTVYAFSVFVKPLEVEFGWDRTTTQWAFSFALAAFAIIMISAGRLQDKFGPRKIAMVGGVLLGLSLIKSSKYRFLDTSHDDCLTNLRNTNMMRTLGLYIGNPFMSRSL